MKVLGIEVNVRNILILIVLYMLISSMTVLSCSRVSMKEGMQMMSASIDYNMGEGVKGSLHGYPMQKGSSIEWRKQDHDSYSSEFVAPEQSMDFFAKTEFKPECCGSSYSASGGMNAGGFASGGCACMNKKQIDYLNTRGGNRTTGLGEF